jgi:hypothetical protein
VGAYRRFISPTLYLTAKETLVSQLVSAAGLLAILLGAPLLFLAVVPVWLLVGYRSLRRVRAARRVGLDGFVEQGARVPDDERARKLAVLRAELDGWRPGLSWLAEVDERARLAPD